MREILTILIAIPILLMVCAGAPEDLKNRKEYQVLAFTFFMAIVLITVFIVKP